jgi:hypothetical protein
MRQASSTTPATPCEPSMVAICNLRAQRGKLIG